MKQHNPDRQKNWKYAIIYASLFLVNLLPLVTEKPYQPQDTQDVIVNLLMVAIEPYRVYGPFFHIATLLILSMILWKPGRMGRFLAGIIGCNYLIIAAAQTSGQTQKYGFVVHIAALVTMIILGVTWLVVAFRNDISPVFRKPVFVEYGLILLAGLVYWGPYTKIQGMIQPDFDPLLLLTSPDYGLTFCFTTPVFLMGLILIYPHLNQFAYRITAFCGLLYALFNLTHWFNPDTRWMGFLHLPLLFISLYALILPGLTKSQNHAKGLESLKQASSW